MFFIIYTRAWPISNRYHNFFYYTFKKQKIFLDFSSLSKKGQKDTFGFIFFARTGYKLLFLLVKVQSSDYANTVFTSLGKLMDGKINV
jgi:hypothetical protein